MKALLNKVISLFPIKKIIMFESNPDYACNTYPVYLEMKKRDFFKKYKFMWLLSNPSGDSKDCILKRPVTFFEKLRKFYYMSVSECLVSCNMLMAKQRNKQLAIFLSHGSKTKKTKGICEIGNAVDYVLCQSHFFDEIIKYEYDLKQEQLVYFGYPRCDYLYSCNKDIHKIAGINIDAKYIIWLPTFRTNDKYSKYDTKSDYDKIGMPIIYSVEQLNKFNDLLVLHNLYIFFKPHPAQDISTLRANTLSNIFVIDDEWLKIKDLQLYELIAKSSALITDYSSVFFDYLLLDKPIATTTDDIEEWKNKRGFAFDLDAMYDKSTVRVPDYVSLENFIKNVCENIDEKNIERNIICNLTNIYRDGNSAKRVVDFIEDKMSRI